MSEIQKLIEQLVATGNSPDKVIWFEVGRFGRCDLFILRQKNASGKPYRELMQYQSQPGEETLKILETLDRLVETDPTFGLLYASGLRREIKSYCLWFRAEGMPEDYPKEDKIAPLYARRMMEQRRILDGKMKRGHMAFGFWPLEGFS